jgi:hypothetical protein
MTSALAHAPAEIVAQMIIDLAKGTDPGDSLAWPVYVDFAPESPDQLIAVDTSESIDGGKCQTGEVTELHGIHVLVRSNTYSAGQVKARDIAVTLDEQVQNKQVTYSGSDYIVSSFRRRGGVLNPTRLDKDSRRNVFTFHGTVTIREVT